MVLMQKIIGHVSVQPHQGCRVTYIDLWVPAYWALSHCPYIMVCPQPTHMLTTSEALLECTLCTTSLGSHFCYIAYQTFEERAGGQDRRASQGDSRAWELSADTPLPDRLSVRSRDLVVHTVVLRSTI